MQVEGCDRYRLRKQGVIVVTDDSGLTVWQGTVAEVRELAMVLNRFLLYGETDDDAPVAVWLSTGDALALSEQHGGPGKDAIRYAARNGRFRAEKDASNRWQYERASFMRWLLDDAAHQPGRKE